MTMSHSNEEFSQHLAEMAYELEVDDFDDNDWIPPKLRRKKTEKEKTSKDLPSIHLFYFLQD